ncbi:MAG: DUF2017 family protein [Ilumatobacteraceae bacterium]
MSEPRIVTRSGSGYVLHLGKDERALVARLLDELRELVDEPDEAAAARLFPVVHADDEVREAEYQRLTRADLVTSRIAAIDAVGTVLARTGRKVALDEDELLAFMQSVNALRLVLGTVLDITEDDDLAPSETLAALPEYQLYGYLSWVLDATVQALSGAG